MRPFSPASGGGGVSGGADGPPLAVSVVIPTHNRSDALEATLARLAGQEFEGPWEVVVVNNRCTDDTDEVVRRQPFPAPLRLVHEERPGAAAARNAGAAVAKGRYLIFIDNDILVEPDFLKRHLRTLEGNPGCWVVGQVINLPEQQSTPFGRFRKSLADSVPAEKGVSEVSGLTGANSSMPRADFESLGGFDEHFFVASGEDRELAMRALRTGIRILFDPSIVVLHNDWAGASLRDYCFRQRTYCQTEPFFWRKYGDEHPRLSLVLGNLPPNVRRDSARLFVWKHVKGLIGSSLGQSLLIGACGTLERVCPWPPLLWSLYRLTLAGAIYRGFQEGLRTHPGAPDPR